MLLHKKEGHVSPPHGRILGSPTVLSDPLGMHVQHTSVGMGGIGILLHGMQRWKLDEICRAGLKNDLHLHRFELIGKEQDNESFV